MYYISSFKRDLQDYNKIVSDGEKYQGVTIVYSEIKKHYSNKLYAIKANNKYISNLKTLESLESWGNPSKYL